MKNFKRISLRRFLMGCCVANVIILLLVRPVFWRWQQEYERRNLERLFGDRGWHAHAPSGLITALILDGEVVTKKEMMEIEWSVLWSLCSIELHSMSFTDESLDAIPLPSLRNLVYVDISGTRISHIKICEASVDCPRIRFVTDSAVVQGGRVLYRRASGAMTMSPAIEPENTRKGI